MFPTASFYRASDGFPVDAKFSGHRFARCRAGRVSLSRALDIGGGQSGPRNAFAASLPSLCAFVGRIIAFGSKKQMDRVYASWIIATVEDAKPIRYRTNEQLVGQSIGSNVVPPLATNANGSVTVGRASTPQNTSGCRLFSNVTKEPINERQAAVFYRARIGTALTGLDSTRIGQEILPAFRANKNDSCRYAFTHDRLATGGCVRAGRQSKVADLPALVKGHFMDKLLLLLLGLFLVLFGLASATNLKIDMMQTIMGLSALAAGVACIVKALR